MQGVTRKSGSLNAPTAVKASTECQTPCYILPHVITNSSLRDALRRREQVHNEPKRSVLGKGYRACLACASARRKCSGGIPCLGCQKRTVECKYPESGRSRKGTSTQLPPVGEDATSASDDNATHPGSEQSPLKSHESPMSWSNTSPSPRIGQDHDYNTSAGPPSATNNPKNFVFQGHNSTEFAMPFARSSIQLQTSISPRLPVIHNSQPLTSPTGPNEQQNIEISHTSETVRPLMEQTTNIGSLTMNTGTDIGQTQHEEGVPEPWYQNNFSSINWLPDNWTPDFQLDGNLGPFDHQSLFFGQTPQASNISYSPGNSGQSQALSCQVPRPRESLRRRSQALDAQEVSSPSSQSTHSDGRYYVDGDGARLPRVRKIPYRHSDSYARAFMQGSEKLFPAFKFPETGNLPDNNIADTNLITQDSYSEMVRIFDLTCTASNHYSNFYATAFPSRQMLSRCVLLFRNNFESILPFIHPASFHVSTTHWLFILAMAAVGSLYFDNEHSEGFGIAMHEFLRRAIETVVISSAHLFKCVSSNMAF